MCMPYALSMQSLCICSASTSRSTVSSLHLATYHQDPFLKTVLVLFSPALGQSGSASRHVEESEVAGSRAHGWRSPDQPDTPSKGWDMLGTGDNGIWSMVSFDILHASLTTPCKVPRPVLAGL